MEKAITNPLRRDSTSASKKATRRQSTGESSLLAVTNWLIEQGLEIDTEEVKKVAVDICDEGYDLDELRKEYKSYNDDFFGCIQNDDYRKILLEKRQANFMKEWLVKVGLVVKGRTKGYLDEVAAALIKDEYTVEKADNEYMSENGADFLKKYINKTGFRNKMLTKRSSSMSSVKEAKVQESTTNEEDLYLGKYKVVQKHLSEGAEDDNETSVWKVSCKAVEGESTYILKRFPKKNPDAVKDFEREVAFQKHLKEKLKEKSKLLVNRMYDETSDDTHNVCVFEFARQKLDQVDIEEKDEKRNLLRGLVRALRWLHLEGYVHLDIKWGNMMNFGDGSLKVKFVDCDSCTKIGDPYPKLTSGQYKYTPGYEAPEISTDKKGDLKAGPEQDIWSMGVLAVEICHYKAPEFRLFDRNEQYSAEQREAIIKDTIDELPLTHEKDVLKKMLEIDPEKRLKTQELYDAVCSSRTKVAKEGDNKMIKHMSGKIDNLADEVSDMKQMMMKSFEKVYSKIGESMQMTMSMAKSDIPRTIMIVPDEFISGGKKSKIFNKYRVLILDDAAHLAPSNPPKPMDDYIVNIGKDDRPGFQFEIPNKKSFGLARAMMYGATAIGLASALVTLALPIVPKPSLNAVYMMHTKFKDKKN